MCYWLYRLLLLLFRAFTVWNMKIKVNICLSEVFIIFFIFVNAHMVSIRWLEHLLLNLTLTITTIIGNDRSDNQKYYKSACHR